MCWGAGDVDDPAAGEGDERTPDRAPGSHDVHASLASADCRSPAVPVPVARRRHARDVRRAGASSRRSAVLSAQERGLLG